jgi:hypothetical protein
VGDIDRAYYRSKAEEQEWITQRDPLEPVMHFELERGRLKG